MQNRDVIVIGAGPAGLTAGIYIAYYGFDALIFEEKLPGGEAIEIPFLENFPGYSKGIKGEDFINTMVQQCEKCGAEIHQFEKVIELNLNGERNIVKTEKAVYTAASVIIAAGRKHRITEVPGESQFRGKGVSYCAVCDGFFFKDKKVIVIGENSRAAEVAIFLSAFASGTTLVCNKEKLCAERILLQNFEKQKVEVLHNMELKEIKGDINVKSVVFLNKETGGTREIDTDGVFFQIEAIPNSQMARESGVKVDNDGYIFVDGRGKTNIDGVYAVGDITTCPTKLVLTAVSQAASAAIDAVKHI